MPDYVNPRGYQTAFEAVVYATTIVMLLFVASQVFVRVRSKNIDMGMNDWFVVAAAVRTSSDPLIRESNIHRFLLARNQPSAFVVRNTLSGAISTTFDQTFFRLGSK
jgi:hypothetical protein